MSAATEYAPAVCIPAAARPQPRLYAVPGAAPQPGAPVRPAPPASVASVAVLHAPREIAPAAPLRLTRRGVTVLAVLLATAAGVLVWLAALSAQASSSAGSAGAGAATGPRVVTVQAGDTLWSIASRVAPARDPRAEVDALARLNHLADVDLVPGQQLRVR